MLEKAISDGGAKLVDLDAARALIWVGSAAEFPRRLPETVEWVQLPAAGVEDWFALGVFDRHPGVRFTSVVPRVAWMSGRSCGSPGQHLFVVSADTSAGCGLMKWAVGGRDSSGAIHDGGIEGSVR